MSAKMLLSVAAGGAFGATARYLVMSKVGQLVGSGFPFATLAVNVLGAVILGALIEVLALVWSPPEELRAFLVVGVLGALTTFSTFSMDTFYLLERGDALGAGLYVGASVVLCLFGFWGAMQIMRMLL